MDPQRLFGPITTRTVRIDQFDTFILNNIPYGEVSPDHVNWGAVEYDGPNALGIDGGKVALQWHFGGVPYPISKAIRINYTYIRKWDGSNDVITTAIYLGFQDALDQYVLPQPIPFVAKPTLTFQRRVDDLGPYGGFSTHSWASDPGILASEAQALITRSLVFDAINLANFDNLMQDELGPLANLLLQTTLPVDLDGPAQDYDSYRPFEYTFATLQNDPEKYSQLLFWYFAGRPFRLTKAMRIPLDAVFGQQVLGQSVLKQALDKKGSSIVAATRYGQLTEESKARDTLLQTLLNKATALTGTKTAHAKAMAQTTADTVGTQPTVVPGGNALFIGYSGPDPSG